MKDTPLNRAAYRLGRFVGFIKNPMLLAIVVYFAWVASSLYVGRR